MPLRAQKLKKASELCPIKSAGLVFLYLLLKPLDGARVDLLTFVIKNRDINVKIY